jgi:uncharacterized membrane protein YgdD (TMEM256/DUF423 family)
MATRVAKFSLLAAALCGGGAVALGAFGAHALRDLLDESSLVVWRTAVDYQFWHALALLALGVFARAHATRSLCVATFAFALGIVLFCGSLYALALGAPRWAGVITPFGGGALIVGWFALGVQAWREPDEDA